ncbi:Peptidase M12A, partial [Trinorchestia longiramus]
LQLESLIVILHEDYEHLFDFDFIGDDQEKLKSIWPGGLLNWKENSEGWPEVPYRFGSDTIEKRGIMDAMEHWEEHTCVKFRDDTDGGLHPHVTFEISESECSSKVGQIFFQLWGQPIHLSPGCQYEVGVVIHEIGHALGLFHEQTRSDRDAYIKVIWKNMRVNSIFNNFPFITENYGVLYDYSSIMHYGMLSFSKAGGSVLVTIDPMAQGLIGMRQVLSHMDKRLVNIQYNCIQKWLDACSVSSDPCQHDGYLGADCSCVCPAGTSGDQCQHKNMDYT